MRSIQKYPNKLLDDAFIDKLEDDDKSKLFPLKFRYNCQSILLI
jgi:hypothetical protein